MIPLLLKASGEFPLRDMLRTAAPLGRGRDSIPVYSARDNLGKLTDRIAHFMSGVFWRGSVTTWNLGSTESERNPLGRPYEEAMRRYLLGEAEFPNRCALVLEVASDEDLGPMVSFPVCKNQGGFHYHRFYVPGLDVALYVGNKIPNVLRLRRADGLLEVPIIVRSFQDGKLFRQMAKMARRAEPKGILKRENNWDV